MPASPARELHRYRVEIQLALVPSVDVRRIKLSLGGETMYGESSGGMRELVVMAARYEVLQRSRHKFNYGRDQIETAYGDCFEE